MSALQQQKDLKKKLDIISRIFNIGDVLSRPNYPENISKYYRINRLAYWLVNSRRGFVNMGISEDGIFHETDFFVQAKMISAYIDSRQAKKVLELGVGKGATHSYLTHSHPSVNFFGLDLPSGQLRLRKFKKISNSHLSYGDYNDLSSYNDASMDIVFVIEALGYSRDKEKVIRQVNRILKPDGLFIIYDGYNQKALREYSTDQRMVLKLLWKGMLYQEDNSYDKKFILDFKKNSFTIIAEKNLSKEIMPSLYRIEKTAIRFFNHGKLAKILVKLLPGSFTANAISGYLMPSAVEQKLAVYKLLVAQKK